MPLTWFAHQVPVVGMKLARGRWFDSIALCVGSMMPDLMYSFSAYVGIDTHRWPATFTYGVPLGVVLAVVVRRIVAPAVPRVLPDIGSFRLRSYGVLATRSPAIGVTVASVILGVGSHVTLDWFTHPGRPGPRWFGYDDIDVELFGVTEPLAGVFQLVGHSVGSLIGVWLLWFIGRRRMLETWYGDDTVATVRRDQGRSGDRWIFWSFVVVGLVVGAVWGWPGERIEQIQRVAVGAMLGSIVGSFLIRPRPDDPRGTGGVRRPGAPISWRGPAPAGRPYTGT